MPNAPPSSTILTLDRVLALPLLDWLIEKLLPRPGILVLGGPPKEGKSRLARDCAYRLATGRTVLGKFAARGTGRVDGSVSTAASAVGHADNGGAASWRTLLYNAEGGARALTEARAAYEWIGNSALERVGVYNAGTPCFTERDGTINARTFDALALEWAAYDLVILDPLVNFHTADENNNQQMGAIMAAIRAAAEGAHVGVLIVHHTAKLGDDMLIVAKAQGGGKLRGASAIHGAADSIAMAWPNRGRASLSLTFDLRYAPEEDELTMVTDRTTGRFYRQLPASQIVDPADFAADHGYDVARYRTAFRASDAAIAAFEAARRESGN